MSRSKLQLWLKHQYLLWTFWQYLLHPFHQFFSWTLTVFFNSIITIQSSKIFLPLFQFNFIQNYFLTFNLIHSIRAALSGGLPFFFFIKITMHFTFLILISYCVWLHLLQLSFLSVQIMHYLCSILIFCSNYSLICIFLIHSCFCFIISPMVLFLITFH